MAKNNLVVVESAAKAKTIEKFLGRGYAVRACLGHVRDLPTSKLGVDVEHGFQPQYVISKDRKDIVKRLKDEVRSAETVLLATDPDREGEAIAWHLVSALELDGTKPVSRIEFHEITKNAIDQALRSPRQIDMQRVDAQQARRILDRLIGYPVSGFLGRKVRRGLTAGRVQSVAVRMVVDREREIERFVPREYWTLDALLGKRAAVGTAPTFTASLKQKDGENVDLARGEDAAQVQAHLQGAAWSVADVKEREQQRNPAAPFITSTLQQEASRKLGFNARRTMSVAQQLYEGVAVEGGQQVGLITYMRTDSLNIAESARDEARRFIREKLGADLVPAQPRVYRTKNKLAQEAHEAIRPTFVFREPQSLRPYLTPDQIRLYDLIWKRFVASQMASAVFDLTTVDVDAQAPRQPRYRFRATGSRLKFRGFLAIYMEGRDDDEVQDEDRQPLPPLAPGEALDLVRLLPEQHFTQPPPRFTEATLVKAMEELGIGRPSTYASILSTIVDRGYVERQGKALKPTHDGFLVNDMLVQNFGQFVDPEFTARMEDKLDDVAQGESAWVPVVQEFYEPLQDMLTRADQTVERVNTDQPTDEVCSEGHSMVLKEGRFGRFIACSQYPEHKETRPLPAELPVDAPEESCSHGVVMQLRSGRFGPYYVSTHECGETKNYAPRVGVACPLDGGEIVEKRSKKGKVFYGCANWPGCDWVSWNRPIPEPCPQCSGIQVEMGRGRLRCLKHEGEPPRFGRAANRDEPGADGAAAKRSATRGKSASKTKATRRTTAAKSADGKVVALPRTRTAAKKTSAAPKRATARKAATVSTPRRSARNTG